MVEWGNYEEAYETIHDAIRSGLASAPTGKKITKIDIVYDGDGDIQTITYKEDTETLFTLTVGYDGNKNITSITRS